MKYETNNAFNINETLYEHQDGSNLSDQVNEWMAGMIGPSFDMNSSLLNSRRGFQELMVSYSCAMKTMQSKLEVLNTQYANRLDRNPIRQISTRLKRIPSLIDKLDRLCLPHTIEAIRNNIFDVAGLRVICSYIDDIYEIADALLSQDDITLITRKDYIIHPKPNGYRSLHLIVELPIYLEGKKVSVKVEVQIRTIAMDFWASLEHQLKYKKQVQNEAKIYEQLQECAEMIHLTDERMLDIRHQIEQGSNVETSEDLFLKSINLFPLVKKHSLPK